MIQSAGFGVELPRKHAAVCAMSRHGEGRKGLGGEPDVREDGGQKKRFRSIPGETVPDLQPVFIGKKEKRRGSAQKQGGALPDALEDLLDSQTAAVAFQPDKTQRFRGLCVLFRHPGAGRAAIPGQTFLRLPELAVHLMDTVICHDLPSFLKKISANAWNGARTKARRSG